MKQLLLISIFLSINAIIKCDSNHSNVVRHMFYRELNRNYTTNDTLEETRRVFGGVYADLETFPAVAVLLDRFWITRCSGSVITPYWALTAAHCVSPNLAYVKYNTKHPSSSDGDSAAILYLYRHPYYKVIQEDEGRGMDVTLLHHDLGLVRTRDQMKLNAPLNDISEMRRYNPLDLDTKDLTVLGFGKSAKPTRSPGDELFVVKLRMVPCDRGSWYHCLCGMASPGQSQRGVCAGDSGGPVIYQSVQIGVTSMGPTDCALQRASLEIGATSVFTSTYHYVKLINSTIADAEKEILASGVEAQDGANTGINILDDSDSSLRGGNMPLTSQKPTITFSSASILRVHIPMVVSFTFVLIL